VTPRTLNLACSTGYSGEDHPRVILPSRVGALNFSEANGDVVMDDGSQKMRLISGSTEMAYKRDHMCILPLYGEDGVSKSFLLLNFVSEL
jgi:hypothetical protein